MKKIVIGILLGSILLISYLFISNSDSRLSNQNIISKVLKIEPTYNSDLKENQIVNILLIGNDIGRERRSSGQTGFNTDTLILLSINSQIFLTQHFDSTVFFFISLIMNSYR